MVAPLVRRSFGLARHLELVERAWAIPLSTELDPAAARALRSALAGIDEACDAGPRCSAMRHALGRAHLAASDRERARGDFLAALATAASPAEASRIAVDLVALEATLGESAVALEHARRALALAPAPEIVRDMLRARPELQTRQHEPAWRVLLAVDDGLP